MKAQRKMINFITFSFTLFILASCTNLPSRTELFSDNQEEIPVLWLINDITLEQRIPDIELKEKIPDTLIMLGNKYEIQVIYNNTTQYNSTSHLLCTLWIREQEYTRGLDTYNSITVIITLINPQSQKVILRALHTEETEDSLKSFQHLFTILEELFIQIKNQIDLRKH